MRTVCCWNVFFCDGSQLNGDVSALYGRVFQHGRCDVVCLHSIYLSDRHVRKWGVCVRTLFTGNCVPCKRAERAAAVLLECDHTCGKLDSGMAGWARDSGNA